MKKKYVFWDCDDNDTELAFDIRGDGYVKFIDCCFEYCKYFSLDVKKEDRTIVKEIERFEQDASEFCQTIQNNREIVFESFYVNENSDLSEPVWERKYYLCNEETKHFLLGFGCVFDYLWDSEQKKKGTPENLIFYRSNRTVLFASLTHEGVCGLSVEETEDISEILCDPNWKPIQN